MYGYPRASNKASIIKARVVPPYRRVSQNATNSSETDLPQKFVGSQDASSDAGSLENKDTRQASASISLNENSYVNITEKLIDDESEPIASQVEQNAKSDARRDKVSLSKPLALQRELYSSRNKATDKATDHVLEPELSSTIQSDPNVCTINDVQSTRDTKPSASGTEKCSGRRALLNDSPLRKIQTLLSTVPLTPAIHRPSTSTTAKLAFGGSLTDQKISKNLKQTATTIEAKPNQDVTFIETQKLQSLRRNESSVKFLSPYPTKLNAAITPKAGSIPTDTLGAWTESPSSSPRNEFRETDAKLRVCQTSESISPNSFLSAEIDAVCIPYNSHVQLQIGAPDKANTVACRAMKTPTCDSKKNRNKRVALKFEAIASEPSNIESTFGIQGSSLTAVYVKTLAFNENDSHSIRNMPTSKYEEANSVRIMRFGDIIALQSPLARNRALGVRLVDKNNAEGLSCASSRSTKIHELGFYRSALGDKEKWIVLPSRPENTIRIGSNVRDLESILYNEASLHSMGHPVQSNFSPITLLNVATGGVLSLGHTDDEPDSSDSLTVIINGHGLHNSFSSGAGSSWTLKQVGVPSSPKWNGERIYLLGRYFLHPDRHVAAGLEGDSFSSDPCIGDFPLHLQEQVLLKELIGAMMGLEGRFVQFGSQDLRSTRENNEGYSPENGLACEFKLSASTRNIDPCLLHLVQQILPMCADFVCVNEFINSRLSKFEYGLVAQALASAVNSLIQEYLSFVCQMEQLLHLGKLTIAKLWSYIQPSISALRTLRRISGTARCYKGGHLLTQVNIVIANELVGDERAQEIARCIIEEACKPYMDMLRAWISTGRVYDPYSEFMVENKYPFEVRRHASEPSQEVPLTSLNSPIWEECFCLRRQHIYLINDDIAEKVLTTGKYLNVIRACSVADSINPENRILEIDGARGCIVLTEEICNAFDSSAALVLNLILTDFHFVDNLRFVKKYFLIEQGDFFVQFLDMAEKELLSAVTNVSKSRIQSLLLMSIQSGSNNLEGHSKTAFLDELVCEFARDHLIDRLDAIHRSSGGIMGGLQLKTPSRNRSFPLGHSGELKGIETLTLDCTIEWPLSLILSRQAMELYKLLFRHIFFCKYVERRLFGTWLDHQMLKEFEIRSLLGETYCLRQRMLHLMQNLVYYMMFEVIEPQWHKLMDGIANVRTVDDLVKVHSNFQATVSQECLLTNITLLRILAKLMTTCLSFTDHIRLFMRKTGIEEEFASAATEYRLNRWNTHARKPKAPYRARKIQNKRNIRLGLQTTRLEHELKSVAYQETLNALRIDFDSSLSLFMDQLKNDSSAQSHSHFANLAMRLDFNYFISNGR